MNKWMLLLDGVPCFLIPYSCPRVVAWPPSCHSCKHASHGLAMELQVESGQVGSRSREGGTASLPFSEHQFKMPSSWGIPLTRAGCPIDPGLSRDGINCTDSLYSGDCPTPLLP